MDEHLYIVTYDIADQRRWRSVFRTMNGYGEWLQLSVFQCRLSHRRQKELVLELNQLINHVEDHVVLLDLGKADTVKPRVQSLGKEFNLVQRESVIV